MRSNYGGLFHAVGLVTVRAGNKWLDCVF